MGAKYWQLNAGKRRAAWHELDLCLQGDNDIKIILIQEPTKSKRLKNSLTNGEIHYRETRETPRTGVYVNRNLFIDSGGIILTDLSDRDQTAVRLKLTFPGGNQVDVVVCSVYFPGLNENKNDLITDNLRKLVSYCKINKIELILGGDVNAHHASWGCKSTDKRGEILADFILEENLVLLNQGSKPTFEPENGKGKIIDLTLATPGIGNKIFGWKVVDKDSFSDHKLIQFSLNTEVTLEVPFRSKRATRWEPFQRLLTSKFKDLNFQADDIETLNEKADLFGKTIIEAYESCSKLRKKSSKKKKVWHNETLEARRVSLKREYRKARTPETRAIYRINLNNHMKDVNKARSESWKRETHELESIKDVAKMQKLF